MSNVYVYGMNQEVFFNDDNYTNYLVVDLEELHDGNLDKAFQVDCQHSAYSNFRQYYGINHSAKIPSGATKEAIQGLCNVIAENAQELTKGFHVEWNGSNHVAVWRDEAGEKADYNTIDQTGFEYWSNTFAEDVAELDVVSVWDLADYDGLDDVLSAAKQLDNELTDYESLLNVINEFFDNEESGEYYFVNHELAAQRIWERIQAGYENFSLS